MKRFATATVLVPLVVFGTLKLDNNLFSLALAIIVSLGAWEYSQLIQIKRRSLKILYSVAVALVALASALCETPLIPLLIVSAIWWLFNVLWVLLYPKYSYYWYSGWAVRLINGFLIFAPMLAALAALQNRSSELVILLLVLIWSADSGAFFIGKSIGKHRLCPRVSPGKTIEGAIGGVVVTIAVMALYVVFGLENASSEQYLIFGILALLVAVASIVGDLFESLYKRISNIKDSGNLLPGHGGIFDRIDSLTAAAPLFYLAYELLI
ncbi:MAG: CDP-archaeol synthase [Gammaproteobacteria bacterium]|nr:CDP-archaeol synthase [Gammaproteobacteria bacterium]